MATQARTKTTDVEPGNQLARFLEEAGEAPVTLRLGEVRYRLDPERSIGVQPGADDIWANYDPGRALDGIQAATGAWKGLVDAGALRDYICERRQMSSRPPVTSRGATWSTRTRSPSAACSSIGG